MNHTLNYIQEKTGYEMDKDIKIIYHGDNITEVDTYLTNNMNQTQIVALFCTSA